ncbi:MAG: polysaccharide biosynthesis tyrosine autokinase [Phycisphaeraceae bacterium]|nr:MAG: polysaccharide biosynthesis tyrosine autokinase [Phycisphaeraceae bacterium]
MARVYWPWLLASGFLGIAVGIGAFFILGRTSPQFTSTAFVEVLPVLGEGTAVTTATGIGGTQELGIAMETRARGAVSDPLLLRVSDQPEVRQTRWAQQFVVDGIYSPQAAMQDLRNRVRARTISDTSYIQFTARASTRDDAQVINKAFTDVFLLTQNTDSRAFVSNEIQRSERDLRRLRTDIDALNTRINNLIDQSQVTSANEQTSIFAKEIAVLQPLVAEARQQIAASEERLENFEQMMQAPGGVVYPEFVREEAERANIAQQLQLQIENSEAALRSYEAQYGPNHTELRRRRIMLQALRDQREQMIQKKMAESFSALVDSTRRNISTLRAAEAEHLGKIAIAERRLNELVRTLAERENLQLERARLLERMQMLETKLSSLTLERERGARVRIAQEATRPDMRSFPRLIPTVAVSVFLIGGAVSGLIFLREVTEQRIRTPLDVSLGARARVLGFIPDISMDPSAPKRIELACEEAPRGATAEAIRQIRSTLLKSARDNGQKAILFVSGLPGSGTTSIVSNLGINIANIDLKVLLIDANLRRPSLHKVFGTGDKPGLAEILRETATLDESIIQTRIPNLSVLPAGSDGEGTYERFNTPAMSELISQAREKYDFIFIDVAPSVVAGDALALSHRVDAVALVVRAYSEKRGLLNRMKSQMEDARASVLGVIVNAIRPNAGGYFKKNFQATIAYQNGSASPATKDAKPVKAKSADTDDNNTNA